MQELFIGKKVLTTVLSLSTLLIMSCSSTTEEVIISSAPINNSVQTNNYTDSEVYSNLSNELKKQKITLKSDEVKQVQKLLNVKPTGEWTPGPENDSKANLQKHFLKHKNDFKPAYKTQEDYLNAAIKAAKDNCDTCNYYFDTRYYTQEKMVSVVKWNSKTLELSVTRDNGQIATYFTDKTMNPPRFILINKSK